MEIELLTKKDKIGSNNSINSGKLNVQNKQKMEIENTTPLYKKKVFPFIFI